MPHCDTTPRPTPESIGCYQCDPTLPLPEPVREQLPAKKRNSQIRLTEEEAEQIRAMHAAGMLRKEIKAATNRTIETIRKVIGRQGKFASVVPPKLFVVRPIFSDADEDLSASSWTRDKDGYARREVWRSGVRLGEQRAHRVVMHRVIGRYPETWEVIDHINGNPLDNRRENLRLTDWSGNAHNRKPTKTKAGFPFVARSGSRWRSGFMVSGKRIDCGFFDSPAAAYAAVVARRSEMGIPTRPLQEASSNVV